jgi:hypothetical protein
MWRRAVKLADGGDKCVFSTGHPQENASPDRRAMANGRLNVTRPKPPKKLSDMATKQDGHIKIESVAKPAKATKHGK